MIVKGHIKISRRNITYNKIYPVICYEQNTSADAVRIVDDFGSLSIYDRSDFEWYTHDVNDYEQERENLVYHLVDYPSFLEDYYNDEQQARENVNASILAILKSELIEECLLNLILSTCYTIDEVLVFIEAIKEKMTTSSAKRMAEYFQLKKDIDSELQVALAKLLSDYPISAIYDLFSLYISDETMANEELWNILVDYFNEYPI